MELREYQKILVNDTRKAFSRGSKRPLVVLPCGGGKTACFADMARKHIHKNIIENQVWFLVHRQELIDQTLETFEKFNIPLNNIFVGMVQSLASKIRRGIPLDKPTMIIFDEAHHATAKTWQSIVDYFDDVPTIGLTATPARMSGESLGHIFDEMILGVDEQYLVANGYLAHYDYYAPSIMKNDFEMKGSDFDQQKVADLFEKKKIYGDILKYVDNERKTIIYCPNIAFSESLASMIKGAVHFDGSTPKDERRQIVKDFKNGKIRVLLNVDLIGEGFDVPDCDTVILLRPTMSLTLYIQQSMRALRPKPDGRKAIIYDLVGNVFRHGMPTQQKEWSLHTSIKPKNASGEPDLIVRTCQHCLLTYPGTKPTCPFCGKDNGKTRKQIEQEKQEELEKIEMIEKRNKKIEQGIARTFSELVEIGTKRGYKNPQFWAKKIIKSRKY